MRKKIICEAALFGLYDTLCDLACRGKISFTERNNLLKSLENIESEDILLDNDKEN